MKHLKRFNERGTSEMLEDIRDICQELKDDGFYINIFQLDNYILIKLDNYILISKRLFTNHGSYLGNFDYKDVSEVIERLKDYLGDRFLKIEAQIPAEAVVDSQFTHSQCVDITHYGVDKILKNGNFTDIKGVRIYYKY